ncbi:MAG: hypothetical protein HOH74_08320 [Gemmatimonadetes bacterium]|nr:hypothetical protein [Gemmatimonadota bacterium]MBT6145418.1 hypothetical protein [Gemmatimonadota bacterium]
MEKRYRVEADLEGELAELYSGILEAFEAAGTTSLGEMNRTLLQTGLLMHLSMMSSFGLLPPAESERLKQLAEGIAGDHLMWEIAELARQHWGGEGGAIDLKA